MGGTVNTTSDNIDLGQIPLANSGLYPQQSLPLGAVANIDPSQLMLNYQGGQGNIPIQAYAKTPNLSPRAEPSAPSNFTEPSGSTGGGEGFIDRPGTGGDQGGVDPTTGMSIGDLGSGYRTPIPSDRGGVGGGLGTPYPMDNLGVDNTQLANNLSDWYNKTVNMPINIEGESNGFWDANGNWISGLAGAAGLGPAMILGKGAVNLYDWLSKNRDKIDPASLPKNTDIQDNDLNAWYNKTINTPINIGSDSSSNRGYSAYDPNTSYGSASFDRFGRLDEPDFNYGSGQSSPSTGSGWDLFQRLIGGGAPDNRGGSVMGKNYGGEASDAPYDSHAVIQNALRLLSKRG